MGATFRSAAATGVTGAGLEPDATARGGSRVLPAALASGALLAAATPPAVSPLFPFVALVPLAASLAVLPAGPRGGLAAVGAGVIVGMVHHAWGLRWLPGTLSAAAGPGVGWPAFAGALGVLAALTGAAAWALHRLLTGGRPLPLAVAVPIVWTALEWTLAHLPMGLAFPWAPLGLGLARWPEALGVAELVGVGGVTAWLGAVNGLLTAAMTRGASGRSRAALAPLTAAVLAGLVPVQWGAARADRLELADAGRVAALALAVDPGGRPDERALAGMAAAEAALSGWSGSFDLVALPEMLVPLDLGSAQGAPFLARLRARAAALDGALLVGTLGVDSSRQLNSALLVGSDPGRPFRADKRRLVPGVERASAVTAPWLAQGGAGGYAAGTGWPVARAGALRAGVLLCYEVAFADDARKLVRNGANALVALTSDAWFGGGDRARSAGVAQHLAQLTLRVIESRTGAARSSNGGPAVLFTATGREQTRAQPGVVAGTLRAAVRPTLFVRTGDVAGPAAVLALVALLALGYRCGTGLPGNREGGNSPIHQEGRG